MIASQKGQRENSCDSSNFQFIVMGDPSLNRSFPAARLCEICCRSGCKAVCLSRSPTFAGDPTLSDVGPQFPPVKSNDPTYPTFSGHYIRQEPRGDPPVSRDPTFAGDPTFSDVGPQFPPVNPMIRLIRLFGGTTCGKSLGAIRLFPAIRLLPAIRLSLMWGLNSHR